jgi:surfeit locus 1 family protein
VHSILKLFSFKPFYISLVLILTTLVLGFWQLKRLVWKNALINTFYDLKSTPAVNIEKVEIREFVKIKLKGTFNRNKKIFFPAKTYNGKAGMRLVSEFTSLDGNKYLIDEGWFDNSKYNYFKNNNDNFKDNIVGYIRYPRAPNFFTPKNNLLRNEWYTYDLISINKFLLSKSNQIFFIKKTNLNRESFLIPSSFHHQFRNNHLQYAITWFCMSLAFFILFLVYLKKNKK